MRERWVRFTNGRGAFGISSRLALVIGTKLASIACWIRLAIFRSAMRERWVRITYGRSAFGISSILAGFGGIAPATWLRWIFFAVGFLAECNLLAKWCLAEFIGTFVSISLTTFIFGVSSCVAWSNFSKLIGF
jgi:hypothetical protein